MSKLYLAAGVAAMAITAPLNAGPGGRDGRVAKADRVERTASGGSERRAARLASNERPARAAQVERTRQVDRPARVQRVETRLAQADRSPRTVERANRVVNRAETRNAERINRVANRVEVRNAERANRIEVRSAERANRVANRVELRNAERAMRVESAMAARTDRIANRNAIITAQTAPTLRVASVDSLNRLGYRVAAPATAATLLGLPISQANAILPLNPVPSSISYLYPSNSMYDYRYNDGYIYQVDKTTSLIAALIPLLAGGYLPGQVLPTNYMNSYVPASYGYNSFYPNYQNQCTRYANGVVYYVDCVTGMIENVMPLYDSGYGVGQMLPSSYGYYNVPDQYRPYYYNTANTGYWYAPGAIYQYDPQTSLITSVAALLSPGLTVGQPLPMGYGAYNVPLGFRDTYYDTPNAMYRYANGNIYQVDPVTQLVTAIVASALS